MARHSAVYVPMAAGALALELLYPLALLDRRLRWLLVGPMVVAVLGFRLLLGPAFLPLILCHVFWVRWHGSEDPREAAERGWFGRLLATTSAQPEAPAPLRTPALANPSAGAEST